MASRRRLAVLARVPAVTVSGTGATALPESPEPSGAGCTTPNTGVR